MHFLEANAVNANLLRVAESPKLTGAPKDNLKTLGQCSTEPACRHLDYGMHLKVRQTCRCVKGTLIGCLALVTKAQLVICVVTHAINDSRPRQC
jgi:hypothetical protein